MRRFSLSVLACVLLSGSTSFADYDVLERHLFEPELVMKHQRDIELTKDQRDIIKQAVQEAQTSYVDFEWELEAETAKMEELVQTSPIDVNAVLTQAEIMLGLENQVKMTQLTMLVRIKNALTEEQQDHLMKIRKNWWEAKEFRKMME